MDDVALSQAPDSNTQAEKPQRSRWWRWLSWASFCLAIILVIANSFITLPYYILSPGQALPVKDYIEIPAENSHGESGKVLLATVSLAPATPLTWAWAKITPHNEIQPKSVILGPSTTNDQYREINQQLYDNSQLTAEAVAFTRAGMQVTPTGDGARVEAVADNSPASGKLQQGDVITAVNGQKVSLASQLVDAVKPLPVGDAVQLQVKNGNDQTHTVDVTLAARPNGQQGSYLGVYLSTDNAGLQTPFPVTFKKTDIGGPSAGLAFTLTLLDEITPGEMTGGKTIAATGTISADGSVGEVGGVAQKTVAVERAGAKIFLVPPGEYDDASKAAGKGLKVITVNSLDEAIAALGSNGGDVSGIPPAK